jgi:Na+-driven multidrug efflux pump
VATWLVFFLLMEEKGPDAKSISNIMRNVFGIIGIFVWAFAATTNTMVSNLIGQGRQKDVLEVVYKITGWSFGFCLLNVSLLNIFPGAFFSVFGQPGSFVQELIPVARMVSVGLLSMSIALIWLNSITGTGKTKVNLLIEIIAIFIYLVYTWYVMKIDYSSLARAWSNELVYWGTIFTLAFLFMRSKRWMKI